MEEQAAAPLEVIEPRGTGRSFDPLDRLASSPFPLKLKLVVEDHLLLRRTYCPPSGLQPGPRPDAAPQSPSIPCLLVEDGAFSLKFGCTVSRGCARCCGGSVRSRSASSVDAGYVKSMHDQEKAWVMPARPLAVLSGLFDPPTSRLLSVLEDLPKQVNGQVSRRLHDAEDQLARRELWRTTACLWARSLLLRENEEQRMSLPVDELSLRAWTAVERVHDSPDYSEAKSVVLCTLERSASAERTHVQRTDRRCPSDRPPSSRSLSLPKQAGQYRVQCLLLRVVLLT
ncbi:hypothetical protein EIP91_006730 [Steccherinum ochraceum]|uniref:Uncharacterized protein n=1 Tax=Steccherinum ochraceum TaxID=92696 RepID=A0A4R0R5F6_9APHY|nr:hypothetical protein EIP91_006730 [Steccherinum ochraceum]